MARTRKEWNYIVCTNDRLELPCLVSNDPDEVARFLGITPRGLYCHFNRESDGAGGRKEKNRYKVLRFEEK